jgi:hypothetical protein
VSDFEPLLVWVRRKGSMRIDLQDSSILLRGERRPTMATVGEQMLTMLLRNDEPAK